jgi:hypothetical protein
MSKPLLVFQGPVATRSGYGDHSRDLLKSLFEMDRFDIKIIPTRFWLFGNRPFKSMILFIVAIPMNANSLIHAPSLPYTSNSV